MKHLRFIVIFIALAVLCALGTLSCGPPQCRLGQGGFYELTSLELDQAQMSYLLQVARGELYGTPQPPKRDEFPELFKRGRRPLVISVALDKLPALVAHGDEQNIYESVVAACSVLKRMDRQRSLVGGWIRIAVVDSTGSQQAWGSVRKYRYDMSRQGLLFDTRPLMVFTPEEVLSHYLMGDDGRRRKNAFKNYLEIRVYGKIMNDCLDGTVEGLQFCFVDFVDFSEHPDDSSRLVVYARGLPLELDTSSAGLQRACKNGGDYLITITDDEGKFVYTYRPQLDKQSPSYNLLRHAGTIYAMMELYQVSGDVRLRDKARDALGFLMTKVEPVKLADEAYYAVVSTKMKRGQSRQVVKLGGNGLALIAICKYTELSHDTQFIGRARQLAQYLMAAQEPDGHFVSKYDLESGPDEQFDSMYYPGEAILGLVRLYQFEPDQRYIETAVRGADWLINVRDKDVPDQRLLADHWLMIGLNELYRIAPHEHYKTHVYRLARSIVDKQSRDNRYPELNGIFSGRAQSTPTATRAEGLAAAYRLSQYAGDDGSAWLEALKLSAVFQQRCQFNRFNAIYLRYPYKALGGFFESTDNYDIRIDYVQHNISSLLGLYKILCEIERPGESFAWDSSPGHRARLVETEEQHVQTGD
ncbi:MAG: glycoside hydrolase family 127 protein [Candidatus Alcyoniella australis]|nr:glycoside hydrolase family 127 protein [Candidatus Alcyoniella australis]